MNFLIIGLKSFVPYVVKTVLEKISLNCRHVAEGGGHGQFPPDRLKSEEKS